MKDNKELTTISNGIYCPKCGRKFQWMIAEEPKNLLVVLHLECSDCGISDTFAVSRREFSEILLGGKE